MKNKTLTFFIILAIVVIGLKIYNDANKPEPIDWNATYNTADKIPFGLYVFDHEAKNLFKGDTIEKFRKTPYEFFDEHYDYDNEKYTAKGTFLSISETTPFDEESIKEILSFASYGNTVFLTAKQLPYKILDTLKIKTNTGSMRIDSIQLSLQNNPNKKYWFDKGIAQVYFDSLTQNDTLKILGYQEALSKKQPNYIAAKFGSGIILLHTQPEAFSNYHLLKGNHYEYAQGLASNILPGTIYWQNGSERAGPGESSSKLRYIMQQPALRAAWQLGLLALLIFIFFNARRKQRIIPEIAPVRNTTVDFAKTIGNLYYQEGNHHTIIEKKIIYFLEKVRTDYLIDTYSLDDDFIEKLHLKTRRPIENIQKAVSLIKKHRHEFQSTEADVITINNAIEKLNL